MDWDIKALPTPCYVVEESKVHKNLKILRTVMEQTGCKILLAQKAFSMFSLYPLIGDYLSGTTASGLYEAKLGREEMGNREVHVYSPAYRPDEFAEILAVSDHIVFNSFAQWDRFKEQVQAGGRSILCGLRVNPEYTEQDHAIYDPCAAGSRLGVTLANFEPDKLDGLEGLHFHTLCEQNADALEHTLTVFDQKFGRYMRGMKWLNFGGGHHITRDDYDVETLIRCIRFAQEKYGVQVYLEPGEAVVLDAGVLVSEVLDFVPNGTTVNAILDTSAACHMPDVLEMPYRPNVMGAGKAGEKAYTYRFGGPTCLAGDIIGDYSFDTPLVIGDRLIFCDMALYTMVKTNTFNGMKLPSIAIAREDGRVEIVKQFGYADFKERLS